MNGLYKIAGNATKPDGGQVALNGDYLVRPKPGSNGIFVDVARHIIAEIEVDEDAVMATATALSKSVPVRLEPFTPDFSTKTSDLMLIAEPHEMPIEVPQSRIQHADMSTLRLALNYLHLHLPNFEALYLIGSRASGISKNGQPVRAQSDHDLIALISNHGDDDLVFGNPGCSTFFSGFNAARARAGLNGIDLMIYKTRQVGATGSLAAKANTGILIAKRTL